MTDYVILRKAGDENEWTIVSAKRGRSSSSAIRQLLEGDSTAGEYVAVPARSWKPVAVSIETKTSLKLYRTRRAPLEVS